MAGTKLLSLLLIAVASCSLTSAAEDDVLKQRARQIESVLCDSPAPSLDQYMKFEECNSFLKLVVSSSLSLSLHVIP